MELKTQREVEIAAFVSEKMHAVAFKAGVIDGKKAYKSQLKKLIEERRKQLQKEQSIHIKGNDWHTAIENRLKELQIVENFIDQVQPPKP